jgi:peptide deformylase
MFMMHNMKKSATVSPTTIVQIGDQVLRDIARPVQKEEFGTPTLKSILTRMSILLDSEDDGVAIAAPQIGESLRIFIVSHRAFLIDEEESAEGGKTYRRVPKETAPPVRDLVFINPEITKLSKKHSPVPEGCLSVRWSYGTTRRADKATVRAQDETGKWFSYGGSGLVAQIFQHEIDHLNGILFVDHATDIEEIPPEKIAEAKLRAAKEKASTTK